MNHPGLPKGWSEPLSGPIITKYCKLAQDNQCWLSLGGFQEQFDEMGSSFHSAAEGYAYRQLKKNVSEEAARGKKKFNTHLIINDEG